ADVGAGADRLPDQLVEYPGAPAIGYRVDGSSVQLLEPAPERHSVRLRHRAHESGTARPLDPRLGPGHGIVVGCPDSCGVSGPWLAGRIFAALDLLDAPFEQLLAKEAADKLDIDPSGGKCRCGPLNGSPRRKVLLRSRERICDDGIAIEASELCSLLLLPDLLVAPRRIAVRFDRMLFGEGAHHTHRHGLLGERPWVVVQASIGVLEPRKIVIGA